MSSQPSDRQWSFIERLAGERLPNAVAAVAVLRGQRLTAKGASEVIDRLLSLPAIAGPADVYEIKVPVDVDVRGTLPHNRYGGSCVLCGQWVEAQVGTYRKGTSARWETLHLPGECPAVQTAAPVVSKGTFSDQIQEITANIPDGRFAIPSVTGTNDLTFFLVATGKQSKRRYVRHIVGGHDDMGRLSLDWIRKAVSSVEELGAHDCMIRFGQEIGSCGHCGRELTDEASRAAGLGPVCAGKF